MFSQSASARTRILSKSSLAKAVAVCASKVCREDLSAGAIIVAAAVIKIAPIATATSTSTRDCPDLRGGKGQKAESKIDFTSQL